MGVTEHGFADGKRAFVSTTTLGSFPEDSKVFQLIFFRWCPNQGFPRRRLARRRLVSGDGVYISATFHVQSGGRTEISLTEIHLVLVLPVF